MRFLLPVSTFIFFAVALTRFSAHAATITVSPVGASSFAVLGEGMTGVAAIDITLAYDSASLATPSVVQGGLVSGALLVANITSPGTVRIAIIKQTPFAGSGQIATVSFAVRNGAGGITSISAKLNDIKGANLPVQASVAAGSSSTASALINSPVVQPAVAPTVQTTSGTTILGAVSMPSENQPKDESKLSGPPAIVPPPEPVKVADEPVSRPQEVAAEKTVLPEKIVESKSTNYGSVLERFKKYAGERTVAAMVALFEKPVAPELLQEPSLAVSDGSTNVRVRIDLPKGAGTSPNFNLSGVEVVSVTHDDVTGALVLELLPKKNVTVASVTILAEKVVSTIPLTLVPPMGPATISADEAAFTAFLKDRGAKKPAYDLNGDGLHDAVDDYIYTGQYLVKRRAAGNKLKK
jgi:hypothetical protein